MDPPSFTQTTGRVYTDGGADDSVLVTDSNIVTLEVVKGRIYLARFDVEETASEQGDFQAQLRFNYESAGFADVNASSSPIKAVVGAAMLEGKNTTDRISTGQGGSSRTFQAGESDNGDGLTPTVTNLNNEHTEFVFPFTIDPTAVSDGEEILLQVVNAHADGGPAAFTLNIDITCDTTVTLTLPSIVHNAQSGVQPESQPGFRGPHADGNGHLFFVTEVGDELGDTAKGALPDPNLWTSEDGGLNWFLLDAVNRPINKLRDMEAFHMNRTRLGPDTAGELWVAVCHTANMDVDFLRVFTDDHASTPNKWDTGATVEATGTAGGDSEFANFVERGDGDIFALYPQTISTFLRVAAQQQAAGVFSSQFTVDTGTASTSYSQGVVSLGESDRVLVVCFDATNNVLDARDVPDNSTIPGTVAAGIDGAQTVKNFSAGSMVMPVVDALQFATSGDKHLVIWLDNSDKLQSVVMSWDGSKYTAGTPEQVSTISVDSDFPSGQTSEGVNAAMAVDYDTGDIYCMFIDATNRDLYRIKWTEGGGWETEVKVFTATGDTDRTSHVSSNVFTHASPPTKVLAWVWTVADITGGEGSPVDGQARYDEFDLTVAAAPVVRRRQLTTVRM